MTPERLVHHELCFGCGRTNLFGILMELEPAGHRRVRGRGFVKQDHQGAVPGTAHEGIIGAALSEAMAMAAGMSARATAIEIRLDAPVPVGTFLHVEAEATEGTDGGVTATAAASVDDQRVATGAGRYTAASSDRC